MTPRDFLHNVLTLLRKEALMILKDRRGCIILVAPILVQTVLFGFVATYDLNLAEYALLDEDHSRSSRELARRFDFSPFFRRVLTLRNAADIAPALDGKRALVILHIGPDFERRLNAGETAPVQVLADGRNANIAGTAVGYANAIVDAFNRSLLTDRGVPADAGLTIVSRAWHNPNLETRWSIMPALMATLSVIQVLIVASQSVAREREQGTMDQLLVTPLGPMTILIGKALPPLIMGMIQSAAIWLLVRHGFGVPCAGSFWLLMGALLVFNLAVVGIGLCLSTLLSTMQQAMLFSFSLLLPMILLSGFATPIASMPDGFQLATLANPVRYGVELMHRIYLEGAGPADILLPLLVLAGMAALTLAAAAAMFRRRLS